jgi:transposase-like protein
MTMSQEKVRKGSQPKYSLATKQAAVLRAEAGERITVIAAEMGCRPSRIYYWLDQWRSHGGEWPEQRRRRRRRRMPAPGSAEREAELERLLGQKQAELDFFHEALRRIEQVRGPTVEPRAPSSGSSSGPGRLSRKAG